MKNILLTFFILLVSLFSFKSYSQNVQTNKNGSQYYYSNVNAGSNSVIFYSNYVYSYGSTSTLTSCSFKLTGTASSSDITSYTLYKSYNSYFDNSAVVISTVNGISLNTITGAISFTGVNASLEYYYTNYRPTYFFLAANISAAAAPGKTFQVNGLESFIVPGPSAYNGAINDAGTMHTITTVTGNIQSISTGTKNITQGQTGALISSFTAITSGGSASFRSVTFPISGTFSGSDFQSLRLMYYNGYDGRTILISSITGSSVSGPSITFTSPNPISLIYTWGGTFYLYGNVADNATVGDILNIVSISGAYLNVDNLTLTGSTTNLTSAIIGGPQIAIQDVLLPNEDIAPATNDNILYKTKVISSNYPAVANGATFTTSGTFTSSDVADFTLWAMTNSTFSNSSSYKIATITSTGSGQILNFTNFKTQLSSGSNWYFYLTANVKSGAGANRTISVLQPGVNVISFLSGTITGSTTTTGIKTIKIPNVSISQRTLTDANIGIGTSDNVIYSVKLSASITKAFLNKAVFQLGGDFTSNEAYYYELHYGSTSDYNSSSYATYLYNYNGANTSITFSGLNIQVPNNSDMYLFLSVWSQSGGTLGKTITVGQGSLGDMQFASANKSGSLTAGSTFTFDQPIVSASSIALSPNVLGINTSENPIYKIELNVSNSQAVLESLNITTTGTYIANDIAYYYAFRLIYSKNDVLGDGDDDVISYQYGSVSTGSGENFVFSPYETIPIGKSYLFVVTDIASATVSGHTISIKPSDVATNLIFTAATVTGSLGQGATFTIKRPNPVITTLPVNNSPILPLDDKEFLIYSLEIDNDVPANISNMDFTFGGTFNSTDVDHYYIYITNSPVLNPNVYINSYYYNSGGSGDVISTDLGYFPSGKTYLHVVAYVTGSATNGATINVGTVSGINVSNGTSVANIVAGNMYTIQRVATVEPFNIQPFTVSSGVENYLYGFKITANSSSYAILDKLVLSVSGTLDPSLIGNYELYYSTVNDPNNANYLVSGTYSTANGQNVTFSGLNFYISSDEAYYIFTRVYLNNTTTTGSTLRIEPSGLDGFVFTNASVAGSYALAQSHVLTAPLVSVTTYALPSKNLNPDGNTFYPIYRVDVNSNVPFYLVNFPISITGNYDNSQVSSIRIFQSDSPVFDLNNYYDYFTLNSQKALASDAGEGLNFNMSTYVHSGKSYFYVTVILNTFTATGISLQVNNLSVGGLVLSNGSANGTSTIGNIFNIKNGSVVLSKVDVPGGYLTRYGYTNVYTIKASVTDADVHISSLTFQSGGTYVTSVVSGLDVYTSKSPVFNPTDVSRGNTSLVSSGTTRTVSLNYLSDLTVGDNYIHLVTYADNYADNLTFGINAITLTSNNFYGSDNVSGSLSAGNLFTSTGSDIGTFVASGLAVPGGKINKGTSRVIYQEKVTVNNASIYSYYLYFTLSGTFTGNDVDQFRLWYSRNPTFDNTAVSVTGTHLDFAYTTTYLYPSQYLPVGDHYYYLVAEVNPNATTGATLYIESTSGTNMYFIYAFSGIGTCMRSSDFVIGVPSNNNDITAFSLPNQVGQSTISGTNILVNLPTGTDLSNLIATFGINADASAFVGVSKQTSGISVNNFTNPVTYKVVSETGLVKNYIVTVSFIQQVSVTGINDQPIGETKFEVYPNPASGFIVVKSEGNTTLEIRDLIGNKVLQTAYTNHAVIDVSNFANGVYFVKFTGKNGSTVKKVVISQ